MFKIGLENRDFCKSLHFYKMDAGKKNNKKNNKKKNELHLLAFSGPRASAEGIARRAMPSLFFFLCCGALASALICQYNFIQKFANFKTLLQKDHKR